MPVFKTCLRPVGIALQALALAAFVPAGTIMARDLADTPAETRALPDLPADLTVPAVPPLAPQSLPVTSPTERFTRPDAGDMETLMRDVRLRSTAPAAQTETPQGADDVGSGEDGPVEDVPSQAVPDAVPYEDLYVIPRTETGKSSVTAPVQAPARTETRPAGTTTPGSFYLGTIQRAGFFELLLHDNAVYALHSDGSELLLPDSVQAEPVLGSDLSYVAISPAQEADLKVPTGLYIFAADGTEKAFLKSAHADHCKALYLSPDGTVLAIDMGGDVNHHLVLYAWPSQQPLDVELFYYPGKTVDMARAREMTRRAEKAAAAAEEAEQEKAGRKKARKARTRKKDKTVPSLHNSPLLWHSGHGLVYRIMDTDTARPCGYEPCGVISVHSWFPHEGSASERALCAGTELCDCSLEELKETRGVPVAEVSMQCTKNIGQWRTQEDKKTSFTLDVPVR